MGILENKIGLQENKMVMLSVELCNSIYEYVTNPDITTNGKIENIMLAKALFETANKKGAK